MTTRSRVWLAVVAASLLSAVPGRAETFNVQVRAYCRPNTTCGYATELAFRQFVLQRLGEMNLEFESTGISFRPNQPQPVIITYDTKYSGMTNSTTGMSIDGVSNSQLYAELLALAAQQPNVITIFLIPNLPRCWNGIPCPGSNEGFDGDDVIFCTPTNSGMTLAHEMGHMWCLRHTFTGQEPGIDNPFDRDGDDVCIPVPDTPGDPGTQESDDVTGGSSVEGHEWCSHKRRQSGARPWQPSRLLVHAELYPGGRWANG